LEAGTAVGILSSIKVIPWADAAEVIVTTKVEVIQKGKVTPGRQLTINN